MAKIATIMDLRDNLPAVYSWLIRYDRVLLHECLPNSRNANTALNKKILLELAHSGADRPSIGNHLYHPLQAYTSKGTSFDEDFRKELEVIAPTWFDRGAKAKDAILKKASLGGYPPNLKKNSTAAEIKMKLQLSKYLKDPTFRDKLHLVNPLWSLPGKLSASFANLLGNMPANVIFEKGQIWRGRKTCKYWFVDHQQGRFLTSVDSVMQCWKKGSSGHPSNIKKAQIKNNNKCKIRIVNLDTGAFFESGSSAALSVGLVSTDGVSNSIRRGFKAGGYHWAYYDVKKHGPIIKKGNKMYASKLIKRKK